MEHFRTTIEHDILRAPSRRFDEVGGIRSEIHKNKYMEMLHRKQQQVHARESKIHHNRSSKGRRPSLGDNPPYRHSNSARTGTRSINNTRSSNSQSRRIQKYSQTLSRHRRTTSLNREERNDEVRPLSSHARLVPTHVVFDDGRIIYMQRPQQRQQQRRKSVSYRSNKRSTFEGVDGASLDEIVAYSAVVDQLKQARGLGISRNADNQQNSNSTSNKKAGRRVSKSSKDATKRKKSHRSKGAESSSVPRTETYPTVAESSSLLDDAIEDSDAIDFDYDDDDSISTYDKYINKGRSESREKERDWYVPDSKSRYEVHGVINDFRSYRQDANEYDDCESITFADDDQSLSTISSHQRSSSKASQKTITHTINVSKPKSPRKKRLFKFRSKKTRKQQDSKTDEIAACFEDDNDENCNFENHQATLNSPTSIHTTSKKTRTRQTRKYSSTLWALKALETNKQGKALPSEFPPTPDAVSRADKIFRSNDWPLSSDDSSDDDENSIAEGSFIDNWTPETGSLCVGSLGMNDGSFDDSSDEDSMSIVEEFIGGFEKAASVATDSFRSVRSIFFPKDSGLGMTAADEFEEQIKTIEAYYPESYNSFSNSQVADCDEGLPVPEFADCDEGLEESKERGPTKHSDCEPIGTKKKSNLFRKILQSKTTGTTDPKHHVTTCASGKSATPTKEQHDSIPRKDDKIEDKPLHDGDKGLLGLSEKPLSRDEEREQKKQLRDLMASLELKAANAKKLAQSDCSNGALSSILSIDTLCCGEMPPNNTGVKPIDRKMAMNFPKAEIGILSSSMVVQNHRGNSTLNFHKIDNETEPERLLEHSKSSSSESKCIVDAPPLEGLELCGDRAVNSRDNRKDKVRQSRSNRARHSKSSHQKKQKPQKSLVANKTVVHMYV